MEQLIAEVANVGFPIIVSIFLLVRVETKLDDLTISINNLNSTIKSQK